MNKIKSVVIALVMTICVSAVLSTKADSFPPGNSGSSESETGSSSSSSDASSTEKDD